MSATVVVLKWVITIHDSVIQLAKGTGPAVGGGQGPGLPIAWIILRDRLCGRRKREGVPSKTKRDVFLWFSKAPVDLAGSFLLEMFHRMRSILPTTVPSVFELCGRSSPPAYPCTRFLRHPVGTVASENFVKESRTGQKPELRVERRRYNAIP